MPEGNAASVIADNDRQLNIGNLRPDTPDIDNWNLIILNAGYPAKHRIKSYENGIATLHKPLELHKGLQALGANIEWVIFPTLDIPLGITYRPDAGSFYAGNRCCQRQPVATGIATVCRVRGGSDVWYCIPSRSRRFLFKHPRHPATIRLCGVRATLRNSLGTFHSIYEKTQAV